MIKTYLIVALVSYLLGSIPFGYILVKVFLKQDIRATGSGNIGATNVARSGNKRLAISTLLLDALKGMLAAAVTIMIYRLEFGRTLVLDCWLCHRLPFLMQVSTLFAVIGHMFPAWLSFRGGKGVATALGGFLLLDPISLVLTAVAFFVVVIGTRYVSLGSMIAALLYPLVLLTFSGGYPPWIRVWPAALTCLLIILKHHENIRRLIAGTESKFGGKKSVPPPDAMEKQA